MQGSMTSILQSPGLKYLDKRRIWKLLGEIYLTDGLVRYFYRIWIQI